MALVRGKNAGSGAGGGLDFGSTLSGAMAESDQVAMLRSGADLTATMVQVRDFTDLHSGFRHPADMTAASINTVLAAIRDEGLAGTPGCGGIAFTLPGVYEYQNVFGCSIPAVGGDYSVRIPRLHIYIAPGVELKMHPSTFDLNSLFHIDGVDEFVLENHGILKGQVTSDRDSSPDFNGKDIIRVYMPKHVHCFGGGYLTRCNGAGVRIMEKATVSGFTAGVARVKQAKMEMKYIDVAQPWTTNNNDSNVASVETFIAIGEYYEDCGGGPKYTARNNDANGVSGQKRLFMRGCVNKNPRFNALSIQDSDFCDVELHVITGSDNTGYAIENVINNANTTDANSGNFHRMQVTLDNRAGAATMGGIKFHTDNDLANAAKKPTPGVVIDLKTWALKGQPLDLAGELVGARIKSYNYAYAGVTGVTWDILARNATQHNCHMEFGGDYTGDNGVGSPGGAGNLAGTDHNPTLVAFTRDSNSTGAFKGLTLDFSGVETANWLRLFSIGGGVADFIDYLHIKGDDVDVENYGGFGFWGGTGELTNVELGPCNGWRNRLSGGSGHVINSARGGYIHDCRNISADTNHLSVGSNSRGVEIDHDTCSVYDITSGDEVAPTDSQGPVMASATRSGAAVTVSLTTAQGADGSTAFTNPTNARRMIQAFLDGVEVAISSIGTVTHNSFVVNLAADPGAPVEILVHEKRRFSGYNGNGFGTSADRMRDNNKVALKSSAVTSST